MVAFISDETGQSFLSLQHSLPHSLADTVRDSELVVILAAFLLMNFDLAKKFFVSILEGRDLVFRS
ncbi:hypothetical protein BJF87_23120 [Gordonia sp. CNJ-863]|nr:hypothetical protein BJF87_23120 [Gordonia sp. CNJ-863]